MSDTIKQVSREHFEVNFDKNSSIFTIKDKSSNGTYKKLKENEEYLINSFENWSFYIGSSKFENITI